MSFAATAAWITAGIAAVSAGAEMYSQKKQSELFFMTPEYFFVMSEFFVREV